MNDTLVQLLDGLRGALCEQLEDVSSGPGCFCGMYPGASAVADWCTCKRGDGCGMAWVRLDRVFPSGVRFPAVDTTASCTTVLAAVIELGVYRCAPIPDTTGKVDPIDLTNAVLRQVADADAMLRAMQCTDALNKRPHVMGTYLPTPGGGDCVGGTWPVTVQLMRR